MNQDERRAERRWLVCEHCGKTIADNGWSVFEPIDGSTTTADWGPAVCYVTEGNVLHEHCPSSARVATDHTQEGPEQAAPCQHLVITDELITDDTYDRNGVTYPYCPKCGEKL